ncbi:MAG: YdaU family protein [Cypionkella sp.]|uniref:YdaU family protein n=1 Tax=Cypionkella sp. TaxID=2811411 RepID=UPI002731460F|nr:YdaU family protein [Cypionkella sp.]MDP2047587.1 YdaU family protein [Cypionkella sp.]
MSLAYFPLYPDRYEADTAHLSMLEDGAYNRLLRLCWRTPGCKLPNDLPWIMRQMRAVSDADQAATLAVLSEFFIKARGKTWSKKLLAIYGQVSVVHGKKVEAGKKGAAAKVLKNKKSDTGTATSTALATLKQPEPEPEPDIKGVPPSISKQEEEGARPSLSVFEEVMLAVGVDPAKPPKFWRGSAATTHVLGWQLVHQLSDDEVVEVARLSRQDNPEPPDGPKALDRHMAAFAKAKASAGSIKPASPAKAAPVHKPVDRQAVVAFWANEINRGAYVAPSAIRPDVARDMLAAKLVTPEQLREKGIAA